MASKRLRMTESQKNLLREGLLVAVIFCLLLAIVLGWFTSNRDVAAGGVNLNAKSDEVTAELYELIDNSKILLIDDDWKRVDRIKIANYLPGENRTYKVVLTNQTAVERKCAVTLAGFQYTVNLNNAPTLNNNFNDPSNTDTYKGLENVIKLSDITIPADTSAAAIPAGIGHELSYYWAGNPAGKRDVTLAQNIIVPAKEENQAAGANTATVQFTFQLDKEADNAYQNQSLSFDEILITTTLAK